MLIYRIVFFLLLSLTLGPVSQASVFVKSTSNKRQYVQITHLGEKIKLTTFSQTRGEDAYILELEYLEKNQFNERLDQLAKNYRFQKDLENWPEHVDKDFKIFSFFPWGKKAKPIWSAKNQWNKEWEEKFGQWIENEVDTEFFKRYNLATDCADAVIGLRWIFARTYSLPVANTINGSNSLFGNFSVRKGWKNLSTAKNWHDDELFKTALDYVMDMTTTRTLTKDGYPVSLDKNGLKVGTFIVTQNAGGGHVSIINSANWDDDTKAPLVILSSTLPRKVRNLKEEIYMEEDWPEKGHKDILAFKWPEVKRGQWQLVVPADGAFSLEQYDSSLKISQPNFIKYILGNIKGNFSPEKLVLRMIDDLYEYVELRIEVVNSGFDYCSKNNCAKGSTGYDYWSTFNRDSKILSKFKVIESMVEEYSKLDQNLFHIWNNFLEENYIVLENVEVNFEDLKVIFEKNEYSSDPNSSILIRWGLNFQEKIDYLSSRINDLFAKRLTTIQNQDENCDETCLPGSIKWLSYSTYHEDKELNQIYSDLMPLCRGGNELLCKKALNTQLNFKGRFFSYFDLIKNIPFFNSDPRAPLELKWGALRENIQTKILPSFEQVTISTNELAVFDEKLLVDLKTEKTIYKAKRNEKIYLSANGNIFLKEGNLKLYRLLNGQKIEQEKIANHSFELEIVSLGKRDYLKISENETCLYEIVGFYSKPMRCGIQNLNIINEAIYALTINKVLILSNGSLREIMINNLNDYKIDTQFLQIVDAGNEKLLLSYESKEEDRYELYLFSNQELQKIQVFSIQKMKLKKAFMEKNIFFFASEFNAEYPQMYLYDLEDNRVEKLQNDLGQFLNTSEGVYYASYEGSQWQSQKIKSLYIWNAKTRINSKQGVFDQIQSQNNYLYLSSQERGEILLFNEQKNFLQSKNLTTDLSCKSVIGKGNSFVYLFDYLYGDYFCHGGIYLKDQTELSSRNYPMFTTYNWLNPERMEDKLWLENKELHKIYSGQVIFFGPENAFWFQETL